MELNTALRPLFAIIPREHMVHNDLIVAAKSDDEHEIVINKVMEAMAEARLTLNKDKCVFCKYSIKIWQFIISAHGIPPDPEKVKALKHLAAPTNKNELMSFLCMMQSHSAFSSNFFKHTAVLRELIKKM